jgi:hypothetical protein
MYCSYTNFFVSFLYSSPTFLFPSVLLSSLLSHFLFSPIHFLPAFPTLFPCYSLNPSLTLSVSLFATFPLPPPATWLHHSFLITLFLLPPFYLSLLAHSFIPIHSLPFQSLPPSLFLLTLSILHFLSLSLFSTSPLPPPATWLHHSFLITLFLPFFLSLLVHCLIPIHSLPFQSLPPSLYTSLSLNPEPSHWCCSRSDLNRHICSAVHSKCTWQLVSLFHA